MVNRESLMNSKEEVRVVFYDRLCSASENQYKVMADRDRKQNELLREHPNWIAIHKYREIGMLGTQIKNRPAISRIMQDATEGKFDLLVVRNISRIARNTTMVLEIVNMLKQYGVEVYFVDDGIWTFANDTEVKVPLKDEWTMAKSKQLSEKIKNGQEMSRRNGVLYGNGNILGYKRVGSTYEIIPDEAETVQIIYKLYLQGYGYQRICKELIQEGRKCKNGKASWVPSTVARILSNHTYKGVLYYKNSDLYTQGNFPPIISAENWDKVQCIRKSRSIEKLQ